MANNRLAIIGAGELGCQLMHLAKIQNRYTVIGFFDDYANTDTTFCDYPILGKISDIYNQYQIGNFDFLVIGIGYKYFDFRGNIYDLFREKIPFATLISPYAQVDSSAQIGEGCCIYAGVCIDKDVSVCANVLINISVCIAHNSQIGKHTFIAPSVNISGFVEVGEKCFLGINSTVIDNIRICDQTVLGAGAVVISHIDSKGTYVGVPVKKIK